MRLPRGTMLCQAPTACWAGLGAMKDGALRLQPRCEVVQKLKPLSRLYVGLGALHTLSSNKRTTAPPFHIKLVTESVIEECSTMSFPVAQK